MRTRITLRMENVPSQRIACVRFAEMRAMEPNVGNTNTVRRWQYRVRS